MNAFWINYTNFYLLLFLYCKTSSFCRSYPCFFQKESHTCWNVSDQVHKYSAFSNTHEMGEQINSQLAHKMNQHEYLQKKYRISQKVIIFLSLCNLQLKYIHGNIYCINKATQFFISCFWHIPQYWGLVHWQLINLQVWHSFFR